MRVNTLLCLVLFVTVGIIWVSWIVPHLMWWKDIAVAALSVVGLICIPFAFPYPLVESKDIKNKHARDANRSSK